MSRLIFCLLLLPALAFAQGAGSLSLKEAESLWREHSRELALARAALSGAEADVTTAGQAPNPALSLDVSSISPWSGYGAGGWKDKKIDNVLRVEQLIERGGKRDLRVKGAEARRQAARFEVSDTGRQQLAMLRRAYFDLLLAQEKLKLAAETADLHARSLEIAEKRLKVGDIAPVDVSRMAVDKARADNDLRLARSDLEQARQALAYLIGRENEAQALLAAESWPNPSQDPLVEKLALDQRPDLEAARLRMNAAEADRDLARALRTRDVTIGAQYEHTNLSTPVNSYGVGISVPIFLWHGHEGEIRRAEADFDVSRLQYEQQRALATGQVGQARSALLAARDRLLRLQSGLLADAERVAKAAELAYGKGAMGLMDLLDARRTLRQVQIEAVTARADYAKALSDWQLQAEYEREK